VIQENKKLLRVAADKFILLRDILAGDKTITEAALRDIISTNLRLLLVDDLYLRAWNSIYKDQRLMIEAVDFNKFPKKFLENAVFWQASGATQGGNSSGGNFFIDRSLSPEEMKELFEKFRSPSQTKESFTIKSFLASPCILSRKQYANRQQVIQYVTNKLGGAHYDDKRTDRDASVFQMLDGIEDSKMGVKILGLHGPVYWEFLAIGQDLINSRDAKKFMARAQDLGVS
jgi:hypothetical protein